MLFNGYSIKKVELEDSVKRELFSGVTSTDIRDLPEEFEKAEAGYYVIEELNQYFKLDDNMIKYGGTRNILFPLFKKSIVYDYLKEIWENEEEDAVEEDYEPSCSSCGDGGCFHCEPWRFI